MKLSTALYILNFFAYGQALPSGLDTKASTEISKRHEYGVEALFGAAIATLNFAYSAADDCPAAYHSGDGSDIAKCGIDAIGIVVGGAFAIFQVQGLKRHGATDGNGRRSLLTQIDLPFEDETIRPGYRVTMTHAGAFPDIDGTDWEHYTILSNHLETGDTHTATAKFHPTEDRQYVSAEAPDAKTADGLSKRSQPVTVYYSWKNEQQYYYQATPHDKSVTDNLAAQIYNHGHDNNLSSFCTSWRADDGTQWEHGYFAMIHGGFTDYSGSC